MRRLLVIEDGDEYLEFARVFLRGWELLPAKSGAEALDRLAQPVDALFIDLRFERARPEALVGDLDGTAARLFAGNRGRALRHLQDQQGTLILASLRAAGHQQPAVFVHPFPARRLENLRRLYGIVEAVPQFDAAAIDQALQAALSRCTS
jgi:CheY-like chemotaxis protein